VASSDAVRLLWYPACARALALTCCLFSCAEAPSEPASRPNVLLVVLDTLRPDHLGLHGYDRPTSPNLDAFAEECIVFDAAQSAAPWTAPALISLMTSLYPDTHAVTDFPDPGRLSDSATTLAEILSTEGYTTAAFTEGAYAAGVFGLDKGFDLFPPQLESDTYSRIAPNIDRFLGWLGAHDQTQPFFALFHTYEPHFPYHAPPEFVQLMKPGYDGVAEHARRDEIVTRWNRDKYLDREDILFVYHHNFHCSDDLRKTVDDVPGMFSLALQYGVDTRGDQGPTLQKVATDYYDAEIRYADDQMQRVWSSLDELGLADNTIVIIVSDHGEAMGEHDLMAGHGKNLHDELLRVVLMMRVPGRGFTPRRVPDIVRSVDVMPTVLELTGTSLEGVKFQGESLVPLLEGRTSERIAYSHAASTNKREKASHTLRTDRWRLLNRSGWDSPQLFDMEADPGATVDVSSEHPDVVRRLGALLEQQMAQDRLLGDLFKDNTRDTPLTEEQLEELRALGYVGER
jgi:arylsulfatase A-like enzyme